MTSTEIAAADSVRRHPGSFRDPAGAVFCAGGRILRGLAAGGAQQYEDVLTSGLLERLMRSRRLIHTWDITTQNALPGRPQFTRVLEHERIPFVSYPYEWSFDLLRQAALLHLDIQIEAFASGIVLTDATAYNIQFRGVSPAYIDVLSFRRYRPGELWSAHRQFCEQFLNPLLLNARFGIAHNAWYRGALEGLDTAALAAILPWRSWLSPRYLIHVLLPARAQRLTPRQEQVAIKRVRAAHLPQSAYLGLIRQLRDWISALRSGRPAITGWQDYRVTRTYDTSEINAKRQFVAEFVSKTRPEQIWDLGCNDGEFLEVALANGARTAIGFDTDQGALHQAFLRAQNKQLNLLPLYQDAANPSPGQGWRGKERAALTDRPAPQAILALAFEHHLAISRNLPIEEVVPQLVSLAGCGVIEFVQKSDSTVQRMLALKGDFFPDYHEQGFRNALSGVARIVKTKTLSPSGRCLYWFER